MPSFTYRVTPTPVGGVLLVLGDDGLVALRVVDGAVEHALEPIALALRALPRHDPGAAEETVAELDAYFDGHLRAFTAPLDWRLAPGFTGEALRAVCEIPYGETASYGQIAIAAGRPRAARAVGTACRRTPFSIVVPVHRVVRADGTPGEYGAHPETKRFLLALESAEHPTPTEGPR